MKSTPRKIYVATTLLFTTCITLSAQDAAAPATDTVSQPAIALVAGGGGFSVSGNKGKFQRDFGGPAEGYFGIEKLHIGKAFDDTSRIDIVGRALLRQGDYMIGATFTKDEWFRIDAGYKQFRTWYDGDGGYYKPTDAFYTLSDNVLYTDRGTLWFEAATLFPDKPGFTLRYLRDTRRNTKNSTSFGDAAPATGVSRKLGPAFYDLDETIDTITLDVNQQLEKVAWGGGVRYQNIKIDNNQYSIQPASDDYIDTDARSSSDLFSAHAYVSGDINTKVSYAAGGLVTSLDTDISGSRIFYSGSDPLYDPGARTVTNVDYSGLGGGGKFKQYVANANLTWKPTKKWIIVPSLRMEDYRTDNVSEYYYSTLQPAPGTAPRHADSNNKWFEVTEAIEARFTGFKNWTHNFSIELMQGTGSLDEKLYNTYTGSGSTADIYRDTDQDRFTQKYSYSAHWYAKPGLSVTGQYYYKYNRNKNDTPADRDATTAERNRYPAYISYQSFGTHDFNIRATWRPLTGLNFVTRYDYQVSAINTGFTSGAYGLPRSESSKSTTHIISESISATPHPRLWLLATASYVYDELKSPTAQDYSAGRVQKSKNNYFNGGLSSMLVLTDLDDLALDYTFYKTDNFSDNSAVGLPYGGSERQHVVALSWARRVTEHLNFTLRYTFAEYKDKAYGGHRDYTANGVYGRIQYHF